MTPHATSAKYTLVIRFVLLVAVACALLGSVPAGAQTPPTTLPCPKDTDQLTTFVPDYVRRSDRSAALTVEQSSGARIESVIVTVADVVIPVTLEGDSTQIVVPVKPTGDVMLVDFDWDQDVGRAGACHGNDTHEVPVIASGARVGNVDVPRLSGAFRVAFTPINYKAKADTVVWSMRPDYDVFGCVTRLKSSSGRVRRLSPGPGRTYVFEQERGTPERASCIVERAQVNTATGEVLSRTRVTIRRAYRSYVTIRLTLKLDAFGDVSDFTGKLVTEYRPTAVARARHCTKGTRHEDRVKGTLK